MSVYYDEVKKTYYCKFSYVDWTGKTRWTTKRGFDGKKKAAKYEREFKQNNKESPNITVSELIEAYLADCKIRIRASTYTSKRRSLELYVKPYLGNIKITDLSPARLRKWQNMLLSYKKIDNTVIKKSTANVIQVHFTAMLNYAVKYYGLPKNHLSIVGSIGANTGSIDFWEESEFNAAIKYASTEEYRVTFYLLFFSGMRIGELRALEIDDMDFSANRIRINKSYSPEARKVTEPKTASSVRSIVMPTAVMNITRSYIDKLPFIPSPLFPKTENSVLREIKNMARLSGMKQIRVHDLRHSHVSYLIHHNVPITAISKRVGHKNPSITLKIYSHMYKESDSDITQIMDKTIKSWSNLGQ
jgi:integrase